MEKVQVYVINYKNDARRKRMEPRLEQVGICDNVKFLPGVDKTDSRIQELPESQRGAAPCMFSHLEALQHFLNSDAAEFGKCIVCEDDIHISLDFQKDMPGILAQFDEMRLDILLLGYLICENPRHNSERYPIKTKYTFHNYGPELWGTQMYLLSREHARHILNTFTREWASKPGATPFSADWTITKCGERAFIYPMIGVEENNSSTGGYWQEKFHNDCHAFNFDPAKHTS